MAALTGYHRTHILYAGDVCGRSYSTKSNRIRYARIKCFDCDVSFPTNARLRKHLETEHNKQMEVEKLEFLTEGEFRSWKRSLSKTVNCRYIVVAGKKMKKVDEEVVQYIYFNCNRRFIKGDYTCTSQIILTKKLSGEHNVMYYKTHYGHEMEIQNVNLPNDARKDVGSGSTVIRSNTSCLSLNDNSEEEHQSNKYKKCEDNKKCPLCEVQERTLNDLDKHIYSIHNIKQDIEEASFDTMDDFLVWKKQLEAEQMSRYVKGTTSGNKSYYLCHRSGSSRGKWSGQRKNSKKSIKMGCHCPARIVLSRINNKFYVKLMKTHVGHELSIKFLLLSTEERNQLAGRIKEGVPFDQILSEIRDSVSTDGGMSRLQLVKKKDLHNIKRDYSLPKDKAHNNKNVISGKQEQSLSDDNPVILHKRQGVQDEQTTTEAEDLPVIKIEYEKSVPSHFQCKDTDNTKEFDEHNDAILLTTNAHKINVLDGRAEVQSTLETALSITVTLPDEMIPGILQATRQYMSELEKLTSNNIKSAKLRNHITTTIPARKNTERQRFLSIKRQGKPLESLLKKPTNHITTVIPARKNTERQRFLSIKRQGKPLESLLKKPINHITTVIPARKNTEKQRFLSIKRQGKPLESLLKKPSKIQKNEMESCSQGEATLVSHNSFDHTYSTTTIASKQLSLIKIENKDS